jgi:hypothetical protein
MTNSSRQTPWWLKPATHAPTPARLLGARLGTAQPRLIWSTGSRLWTEANKEGQRLPLIFSATEADSGLIYPAYVEEITVTDDGTACVHSELRPIDPPRPLSSLRLKSTGRPLSDSYIRPYAICKTPDFLD